MKKSTKLFFVLILVFVLCLLFLNWARNYYYPEQSVSPVARIRNIFVFFSGILILKLTATKPGFKIFLFFYIILWATDFTFVYLTAHSHNEMIKEMATSFGDFVQLRSPLPLIFFWIWDRVFFVEKTNLFKREAK